MLGNGYLFMTEQICWLLAHTQIQGKSKNVWTVCKIISKFITEPCFHFYEDDIFIKKSEVSY